MRFRQSPKKAPPAPLKGRKAIRIEKLAPMPMFLY